jgi:low temperature requirement protein LtrA
MTLNLAVLHRVDLAILVATGGTVLLAAILCIAFPNRRVVYALCAGVSLLSITALCIWSLEFARKDLLMDLHLHPWIVGMLSVLSYLVGMAVLIELIVIVLAIQIRKRIGE